MKHLRVTLENILNAFAIAKPLWFLYGALANIRLMEACGKEKIMLFQPGKLSGILKELITALRDTGDN